MISGSLYGPGMRKKIEAGHAVQYLVTKVIKIIHHF